MIAQRFIDQATASLATPFSRSTLYPKLARMSVEELAAWYANEERKRDDFMKAYHAKQVPTICTACGR